MDSQQVDWQTGCGFGLNGPMNADAEREPRGTICVLGSADRSLLIVDSLAGQCYKSRA